MAGGLSERQNSFDPLSFPCGSAMRLARYEGWSSESLRVSVAPTLVACLPAIVAHGFAILNMLPSIFSCYALLCRQRSVHDRLKDVGVSLESEASSSDCGLAELHNVLTDASPGH